MFIVPTAKNDTCLIHVKRSMYQQGHVVEPTDSQHRAVFFFFGVLFGPRSLQGLVKQISGSA